MAFGAGSSQRRGYAFLIEPFSVPEKGNSGAMAWLSPAFRCDVDTQHAIGILRVYLLPLEWFLGACSTLWRAALGRDESPDGVPTCRMDPLRKSRARRLRAQQDKKTTRVAVIVRRHLA